MSVQDEIRAGLERIAVIGEELAAALAAAKDHEEKALQARASYFALKQEREALTKAIGHQRIISATEAAQQAALTAQREATDAAARIAEKESRLDAALAKIEAANKEEKPE